MLIPSTTNIQMEIEVSVHVYLQRQHDINSVAGRWTFDL